MKKSSHPGVRPAKAPRLPKPAKTSALEEPAKADDLRLRAEAWLRTQQRDGPELPHGADASWLLHELQIHQIQLEMQTQELLDAQRRIDELAARNRALEDEILQRDAVESALKNSGQLAGELLEKSRCMQTELRDLSRKILQVQEDERKRISLDLHDEVSQTLVGINVHLAVLIKEASINPLGLQEKLARTLGLVQKSVDMVHRHALELRPSQLDDLGLIPALRAFIESFKKPDGLHLQFKSFPGVEALDNDKRTMLFRVAQEALTNVARHAGATLVKVTLSKCEGGVCMEISDNGKVSAADPGSDQGKTQRLGHIGMRERVEIFGGSFDVMFPAGKGTLLRVKVPFKNDEKFSG